MRSLFVELIISKYSKCYSRFDLITICASLQFGQQDGSANGLLRASSQLAFEASCPALWRAGCLRCRQMVASAGAQK